MAAPSNNEISGAQQVTPRAGDYVDVLHSPLSCVGEWPVKKSGTFVANGATPVVIPYAGAAIGLGVLISFNTLGGTQGAQPVVSAIVPGVSFSTTSTAGDTSIYNYYIIG